MEKIENRKSKIKRSVWRARILGNWILAAGFWLVNFSLSAQTPPPISPNVAAQLIMQPQPPVENVATQEISASAEFDPQSTRVGGKTFYRVRIAATQNSIIWPEKISAPLELQFDTEIRGQLLQPDGAKFSPLTEFVYEITPTAAGHFVISNFVVSVDGRVVEIPSANLDVDTNSILRPARKLILEVSETNLFFGQPFRMRVILPAAQGNQIDALRDVQFNGSGFLTDKLATRQTVETINRDGNLKPAFVYETIATPMTLGALQISAQAFTAGREFSGPVVITGQVTIPGGAPKYDLLASDVTDLKVRALPQNELPGFTGAMGKFLADAPQISTNKIHVGEPVKLKFNFRGAGNLTRFVPPDAPRSRDWQIIAGKPGENFFTLVPLTDEITNTPEIPFCAFDPATKNYYDLTIPALPIFVIGEGLPTQLENSAETNSAPLKLSSLAQSPGKSVLNLRPPQTRFGLILLQFLPLFLLFILWRWDERKRYLEMHPEIVRRQKAKRDLRREKKLLSRALVKNDAKSFSQHGIAALQIAVAPHFPADARAMVCSDVMSQFETAEQNGKIGEAIRKVFAAADSRFANPPQTKSDLFALKCDLEIALQKLEEKL